MKKESINELNSLLKGEYMAIDGYEKYIERVGDSSIGKELQKIQQDHKQHAIKIAERIQNLGGHPVRGVGFAGKVAETMANIRDIGKKDDILTLKEAYDGENFGIEMATEIVKGDLDSESACLVKNTLNEDRNHLDILNNLIRKSGHIE